MTRRVFIREIMKALGERGHRVHVTGHDWIKFRCGSQVVEIVLDESSFVTVDINSVHIHIHLSLITVIEVIFDTIRLKDEQTKCLVVFNDIK